MGEMFSISLTLVQNINAKSVSSISSVLVRAIGASDNGARPFGDSSCPTSL
jgi:hypothetical protein